VIRELTLRADPTSTSSPLADGLLAAAIGIFIMIGTFFASHGQTDRESFDVWTAVLIVVAAAALAVRRRYPVAVLATVFAVMLAYLSIGYAQGPIWIALLIAYFNAVTMGHGIVAATFAVIGFGLFPWLDRLFRHGSAPSLGVLAASAAWLLVFLAVAEAIRIRRERTEEAVRSREEETLRRASEERLRIARELHDALGHHLSLISVQAGVALHVNEQLPEQVSGSLSAIKQASREALSELRSVLEILRQDGERAPRSPTSTLARLDDLVARSNAAGLEVHTETEGEPRLLPFGVDVAAFRIVQESLTNVARHAGPAVATVRLSYGEHDLTVQIDDDGAGSSGAGGPGSGRGLLGMRERAAALGGDLEAGPRPGGGFRVRARLPLDGAA
jgi:signal transduction histidine kinase